MIDLTEVVLRLGAATLIGAAIGLNRDLHGKPIGVRTLGLVGLASAIVTLSIVSYGGEGVRSIDAASRVILAPLGRSNVPEGERLDLVRLARELGDKAKTCDSVDAIVTEIAANVGARPTAPTIPETTRSAGRLAASSIASSPAAISICRPATPAFRSGYPAGSAIAANFAPSAIAERASAAPSRPPTTASTAKRSGAAAITCVQDRPIEPVAPSNTSRFGRAEPGAPAAFT